MSPLVQQLDELLFSPTGWFAIAVDNQAVPGVRVPTLETGLTLVGEGSVATVVGRVRPEVLVADVDLAGERGHAVVEQLAAWCHRTGVWHLVRPSGGADGRHHLFMVPGEHSDQLEATVAGLRRSMKASARALDLRRSGHIRPLSAPHRHGAHTKPLGDLREALRGLRRALAPTTPKATNTSAASMRPPARSTDTATARAALAPKPRRRVDLPAPWANYLRTGVAPAHGGQDHSRSTDEVRATRAMLHAGHTAETAWALITAAHPDAMTRARANRRRWVAWVWNDVVEHDTTPPASDRTPSPETTAAVSAARQRLLDLAWTIPPRRRRSLLLVGHHVLDRIARTDTLRVPVPERDLVLDTGLTDRKTIRTALRLMDGALGALHTDTWDPKNAKDSSSYEFEVEAPPRQGVREIPPPGLHTPLPRGLWTQLPGQAHALWRTLQSSLSPLEVGAALHTSALTESPTSLPTAAQLRAGERALTELARAGLAHCTAEGTWVARNAPSLEHTQRAARRHDELAAQVATERAEYRNFTSSWSLEQARARKAQFTRERAWWNALDHAERAERRDAWRHQFDSLPVLEQERLKSQLAHRRLRVGVDEAARHRAWAQSLPHAEHASRASERQRRYDQLPRPLQQASVAAWERHRIRFGLHRHTPIDAAVPAYPDTANERDEAFLATQATLFDAHVRASEHGAA